MGWLAKTRDYLAEKLHSSDKWFHPTQGGWTPPRGSEIASRHLLTSGPIYQAVSTIAGDLATLPYDIYRIEEDDKGNVNRVMDRHHHAWSLLNQAPNPDMTAATFWETMYSYALLHGNALAYIVRDELDRPQQLIPMKPNSIFMLLDYSDRALIPEIKYIYTTEGGATFELEWRDVFHIIGLGPNARWGYDVTMLATDALNNGILATSFSNNMFINGTLPSGYLANPDFKNAEEINKTIEYWERHQQGFENAFKPAILAEAWEWHPTQITGEQAQLLETRRFHPEEVARFFKISPFKLGVLQDSSVRSNLEEQQRDYLQSTLMYWKTKVDQEVWLKLFSVRQRERRTHQAWLRVEAFVRANELERAQAAAVWRQWGIKNADEVREGEMLNPIGGEAGQRYLVPGNMGDAESGEMIASSNAPAPVGATEQESVEQMLIERQTNGQVRSR